MQVIVREQKAMASPKKRLRKTPPEKLFQRVCKG